MKLRIRKSAFSITAVSLITTLIFSFSCSDEDLTAITELQGKWNLVNVTCECSPADLQIGQHIWVFNIENNTVTVSNEVNKPLQILDSDTYEIDLTNSTIKIKTVTYDYYFEEGNLFLANDPHSDGPLLEFVR